MSRPAVSVVMPFAGDRAQATAALAALHALELAPGDELILADNSGTSPLADGVEIVPVTGERSPSHARNAGAERASADWILFLDADCEADPGLLAAYFATPVDAAVGALAGAVLADSAQATLPARYAAARGMLGLDVHLAHAYLPRAVAANLLVRRAAFAAIGGFYEGVRAGEDTDFTWRLQRAGWRLEGRPGARVRHRHRASLGELRRQWRGYAAGRAWLSRRYPDFTPEPALRRAGRRLVLRTRRRPAERPRSAPAARSGLPLTRRERGAFLALDALLGIEELAGFALSNRPTEADAARTAAHVVLVAERFPAPDDPFSEFARTLSGARVEAGARPESFDPRAGRALAVAYREDDGFTVRLAALAALVLRHPLRAARDRMGRAPDEPSLLALAASARRIGAEPGARIHPLGATALGTARRLAALTGRPLSGPES